MPLPESLQQKANRLNMAVNPSQEPPPPNLRLLDPIVEAQLKDFAYDQMVFRGA